MVSFLPFCRRSWLPYFPNVSRLIRIFVRVFPSVFRASNFVLFGLFFFPSYTLSLMVVFLPRFLGVSSLNGSTSPDVLWAVFYYRLNLGRFCPFNRANACSYLCLLHCINDCIFFFYALFYTRFHGMTVCLYFRNIRPYILRYRNIFMYLSALYLPVIYMLYSFVTKLLRYLFSSS